MKATWDEQVLVSEAWDEQVLVSEEWQEQVVTGWHNVFFYDGYVAYTDEDTFAHAMELDQQGVTVTSWYAEPDYETVHHPDEYETVHHDAEYKTVHHEAEYTTVHHDAEGYWA